MPGLLLAASSTHPQQAVQRRGMALLRWCMWSFLLCVLVSVGVCTEWCVYWWLWKKSVWLELCERPAVVLACYLDWHRLLQTDAASVTLL